MRQDVVVPFAVPFVGFEGHGSELGFGDLDAGGVVAPVPLRGDPQPGVGGRGGDELDHGAVRGEGTAPPVLGDEGDMRCSMRFHFDVPGG